jgi:hypothetical protein
MYKKLGLDETGREIRVIIRTTDQTYIPFDENNRDYQKYLQWVAEGNEPLPADSGE